MIESHEIHPLNDFLRDHERHLARLKQTRAAEVLTVDGRAEAVILDAGIYAQMRDRIHYLEDVEAIREGLRAADAGDMIPAEEFFEQMQSKYGIP